MDWQQTCRVCLETGDMVSFFDWDENNEQLCDKYAYCVGVQIKKDDTLPTLICLNCVDRLTVAYQFKQQCISSNETLKECFDEFMTSSTAINSQNSLKQEMETETITIKQENGLLLQYELPVEHDPQAQWTRTLTKTPGNAVVTKAPKPRMRGRPRKYPNEQGQIDVSPYQRKKETQSQDEPEALTTMLASGSLDLKEEPTTDPDEEHFGGDDYADPDFNPDEQVDSDNEIKQQQTMPKKRGRPRKNPVKEKKKKDQDEEDVLLKETIMAYSEPIPDHILNPKPKKKYPYKKKKYVYEKMHTCETCGSSFSSNSSLQAHIRRHLGIKPFVCSVCGYACVLNMELRRHMLRHTGVRPYKCRICDRRFGDFGSRQKHESLCGYTTSWSLSLKRHMIRHTGVRPLQCRYCERRFVESSDRQKHESVCSYTSVTSLALRRHMLTHTGEKPYRCRHCSRAFADYGSRQKHERLHLGVRPYQCSLCGKSFTYSYVLANHMLTHTGEKKYSCDPCGKKFTKAHHLKYHNKVHHKELYARQQLEAEARRVRQQINVATLTGVLSGSVVDGTLQIVHSAPDGEQDGGQNMEVVEYEAESQEDSEEKETDRAVAGMQAGGEPGADDDAAPAAAAAAAPAPVQFVVQYSGLPDLS